MQKLCGMCLSGSLPKLAAVEVLAVPAAVMLHAQELVTPTENTASSAPAQARPTLNLDLYAAMRAPI